MLNIHPIHQTLKLGLEQASQSYQWILQEESHTIGLLSIQDKQWLEWYEHFAPPNNSLFGAKSDIWQFILVVT